MRAEWRVRALAAEGVAKVVHFLGQDGELLFRGTDDLDGCIHPFRRYDVGRRPDRGQVLALVVEDVGDGVAHAAVATFDEAERQEDNFVPVLLRIVEYDLRVVDREQSDFRRRRDLACGRRNRLRSVSRCLNLCESLDERLEERGFGLDASLSNCFADLVGAGVDGRRRDVADGLDGLDAVQCVNGRQCEEFFRRRKRVKELSGRRRVVVGELPVLRFDELLQTVLLRRYDLLILRLAMRIEQRLELSLDSVESCELEVSRLPHDRSNCRRRTFVREHFWDTHGRVIAPVGKVKAARAVHQASRR